MQDTENENFFVDENKEEEQEEIKEETKEEPVSENIEEKLKLEIDDMNNKYLRLAADFDNYRKRQMQERENLIKYGAKETLTKLIPVLDTFKRAYDSIEKSEDIKIVKESFEISKKQLFDTLEKIGLTKIEAKGEEFDPNLHEAVMQTPTEDYPPHTVIDEMQDGYKLFDMVLRPAYVNVAVEKTNEE